MRVAFVYMNKVETVGYGAGYVAGAILQAGHELTLIDSASASTDKIAKIVIKGKYDILMISTMTMLFPEAMKLARLIKQNIKIPILLGGLHSTIIKEKILADHPEIDFLCVGEGESMAVEFLNLFKQESLYGIKNLGFRRDGIIKVNPIRPPEDLSKLPGFPWHLFPKRSVLQENGSIYVNAARGCPFKCTYCCNSLYLDLYGKEYLRFRPVDQVIDELKYLNNEYKPTWFYFGDEMIFSKKEQAQFLFSSIKRDMNMPYGCLLRPEYVKPEVVKLLADTGCRLVGMGIECGDEQFRRQELNRFMSNETIEEAFSLLKNAGVFVTSFNMIGYPFEYDNRLTEETVRLNRKISPDYAQFTIFYPFPGTKLHKRCVDLDLIDEDRALRSTNYYNESVLKGVTIGNKRTELAQMFNPKGLVLPFRPRLRLKTLFRKHITDKIKKGIKQHLPEFYGVLYRIKSRFNLWRRICRELRPGSPRDSLGLIVSVFCDSFVFGIAPHWALSPKSCCHLHLYAPRLGTMFYVRGGTDDIYNILPFREMDVHEAILGKLRAGDVFIDGGANIGYYTILGSRAVASKGVVVAIEAEGSTADQLVCNLGINRITNVTVVNKAVQNNSAVDTIYLEIDSGIYGMATIAQKKSIKPSKKLKVDATTLDQICDVYDRIRMIKLDVEGAEHSALLGAKNTLAKTDYVVIECNESSAEISALLLEHGFLVKKLNFSTYILGYRKDAAD
jgi:FkbM family methyltransferase